MTLPRRAALLLTVLLQACAGWSSFDKTPSHSTPPASARKAAPVASSGAAAGQHRVQSGDTLYSIAFRNNLDYHDLARWNGIGSDYLIRNGQLLRLTPPARAGQPASSAAAAPALPRPTPVRPPIVPTRPVLAAPGESTAGASAPPAGAPEPPATLSADAGPVAAGPVATASAPVSGEMPEISNASWYWPTLGPVSRGFGQQGSKGLDFFGKEGQPVFAAASGRVVYSGNALKGYGELIIVKHDETYLSAYGYNRRRNVKEGDIVTAGQPIAEMGLGPESRPLLHFEIRERGQPINPLDKLPPRAALR